jgi:hypothetical protein
MRHSLIACTLALLVASSIAGQRVHSQVSGRVSVPTGETLSGVTIVATDDSTGETFRATTDSNGRYRFALPSGRYTFAAEFAGSVRRRISGVVITGSRSVDIVVPYGTGSKTGAAKPPPPPPVKARPPSTGSEAGTAAGAPKGGATGTATGAKPGSATGTSARPRTETAAGTLSWNTWTEAYPGPTYEPVPRLRKDKDYLLVLHLSGLPYEAAGVSAQPTSGDLSGWADDWLKTGQVTARLQVLLLPDGNYFKVVDRVKPLDIDLKALRDWASTPSHPVPAAPLAEIRQARENGALPRFVFGEVPLRFHTANREGIGAVGLSIWSDTGRPLDEITLSFCISDNPTETAPPICGGVRPVQQTLKGTDSVRVAVEGESAPDAALHFLELDERGVIGVFLDNTCPDCGYKVWTLGRDGEALRSHLANTTLPAFGPTASVASLADAGRGLYNLLFPDDDSDGDRVEARAAFERFADPDLLSVQPPNAPRSIFVRTLVKGTALAHPLYLPLGLVTVPAAPAEFLGFRFRVEAPLEHQSYRSATSCISRWFLAVPPSNPQSSDALPKARQKFESLMTQWSPRAQQVFETIPSLRAWLAQPRPAEASAALVVLSHHDQSTLYFEQNEKLTSQQVQRRFGDASVLVLDGCSTGAPMALDLVRDFNERGVATTIVSQVAVRPELAGDFVASLGAVINGADAQGLTLADVFFKTLQDLRLKQSDDTALPYGPRALVFSLLGNGATRICSPQKEVQ